MIVPFAVLSNIDFPSRSCYNRYMERMFFPKVGGLDMNTTNLASEIIKLMKELEGLRGETIDFDSILSQYRSSPETVSLSAPESLQAAR